MWLMTMLVVSAGMMLSFAVVSQSGTLLSRALAAERLLIDALGWLRARRRERVRRLSVLPKDEGNDVLVGACDTAI